MKIIKQLDRILKVYYSCPVGRKQEISKMLREFEKKSYLKYSLTGEESLILMKDDRKPKTRIRQYPQSPFPFLSNLEYFGISPGSWNQELLQHGIKSRSKYEESILDNSGIRIHLIHHWSLNYRCNQYLRKQYKRLSHYRDSSQNEAYWKLSYSLMQNSWSYKVACLNNWQPLWYKTESLKQLVKLWTGLHKILSFEELRTQIRNCWIESPKGKWRQLGIPNKSWRLYLHMLNQFVSYIYEPHLPPSIYDGFIYHRGCKSWWESLLWGDLLKKYNWILEIDFTSGFPNLNQLSVRKALLSDGLIPERFVNLILQPLSSELIAAPTYPTFETYAEDRANYYWRHSTRSVHMGLGISPILFVITQHWVFKNLGLLNSNFQYKAYADDLSFYFNSRWLLELMKRADYSLSDILIQLLNSENPLINYLNNHPLLREAGLRICPSKSKWVSLFGIWIKPLNSLGLSFYTKLNPWTQIWNKLTDEDIEFHLKGNTRGRGANPVKGTKSTSPCHLGLEEVSSKKTNPVTLKRLINNYKKYFGLFVSKLYGGQSTTRSNPYGWTQSVDRKSALGQLLKSGFNKELSHLEKWTLYNSGSKMNKLLLGMIRGDHSTRWVRARDPGFERNFCPTWKYISRSKSSVDIPNPLAGKRCLAYPENDEFRKYSELELTSETLKEYERSYNKMNRVK